METMGDRKGIGGRMTKPERHMALCKILNEIYKQKNQNYGDSFHLTFQEEGFAMARIRLTDKFNRFKTLSRNPNLDGDDESIIDTLLDMANYALMTVLEIREANGTDRPDAETISRPQQPVERYPGQIVGHLATKKEGDESWKRAASTWTTR